ncbi:hypothetical protein D3C85_1438280 [compost metagenome]
MFGFFFSKASISALALVTVSCALSTRSEIVTFFAGASEAADVAAAVLAALVAALLDAGVELPLLQAASRPISKAVEETAPIVCNILGLTILSSSLFLVKFAF